MVGFHHCIMEDNCGGAMSVGASTVASMAPFQLERGTFLFGSGGLYPSTGLAADLCGLGISVAVFIAAFMRWVPRSTGPGF
jgi:hypothetical protein